MLTSISLVTLEAGTKPFIEAAAKPFIEEVYINERETFTQATMLSPKLRERHPACATLYAFITAFPPPTSSLLYQSHVLDCAPGDSKYCPSWEVHVVLTFDLDGDGDSPLSNGVFDADDYALLVSYNDGEELKSEADILAFAGMKLVTVDTGILYFCALVNVNPDVIRS